eukprot:3288887-Rhodomonas_salina.1
MVVCWGGERGQMNKALSCCEQCAVTARKTRTVWARTEERASILRHGDTRICQLSDHHSPSWQDVPTQKRETLQWERRALAEDSPDNDPSKRRDRKPQHASVIVCPSNTRVCQNMICNRDRDAVQVDAASSMHMIRVRHAEATRTRPSSFGAGVLGSRGRSTWCATPVMKLKPLLW